MRSYIAFFSWTRTGEGVEVKVRRKEGTRGRVDPENEEHCASS